MDFPVIFKLVWCLWCRPAKRILRSAFLSPPRPTLLFTPVKQTQASTSARRPIGRLNLGDSPPSPTKNGSESPRKRQKITTPVDVGDLDVVEGENDNTDVRVKFLTAEGHVEFHRPSSKKLQPETKWQRPCKLHIAYDCTKDIKDSSFYLIIYEGNVKCRRNLMKDFEAEEPENWVVFDTRKQIVAVLGSYPKKIYNFAYYIRKVADFSFKIDIQESFVSLNLFRKIQLSVHWTV